MAGELKVNIQEAAEAVRQYLEDEVAVHERLVEEVTSRNRGLWNEYAGRHRGLWSRMLGRLREAGVDAPEAVIGSAAVVAVGAVVSLAVAARKK